MEPSVQFDEDPDLESKRVAPVEEQSLFIRFVLSTKIVSTEQQAKLVLLGFAALMFLIAFTFPLLLGVK